MMRTLYFVGQTPDQSDRNRNKLNVS